MNQNAHEGYNELKDQLELIISKYGDHQPIDRQRTILKRLGLHAPHDRLTSRNIRALRAVSYSHIRKPG